jgi:transcriptional regulator with XRE-family HTH domain
MSLGARVRRLREERGYSLSDLAREAGIARSYVYQVERGESSPTHEKIEAIAHALGVGVGELLGLDELEPAVPDSLRTYAQQTRLPPADVRMLAQIRYRGKQPTSPEAWHALYSVIQSLADSQVRHQAVASKRAPTDPGG